MGIPDLISRADISDRNSFCSFFIESLTLPKSPFISKTAIVASVSCNHKQPYGDTYGITLHVACETQKDGQMAQNAGSYVPELVTHLL